MPTPRNNIAQLDAQWAVAVQSGRFEVFREIFDYYTPALIRLARLSIPLDVAEDIVQDVMLNLWTRRQTIQIPNGLAPYLFSSVKNRSVSWIRHERIIQNNERATVTSHPPGMGEAPSLPDSGIAENELVEAVLLALEQLSELQREVITLRWEEQMSYEEIAEILSISVSAAKQNGSRAQRTIRARLGEFTKP